MKLSLGTCGSLFAIGLFTTAAGAQVTTRINLQPSGAQVLSPSYGASISADGRLVAFISFASLLVPGDTNGAWDVFVRDVQLGVTTRVSVDSSGVQGNADSGYNGGGISITPDDRYVVFTSLATNLVPGDTNGQPDVFLRDLQNGTTERVSLAANGAEGNERSAGSSISADGRYVAFTSYASNLVPGDTNSTGDIFVRDRLLGTTVRVSVDSSGVEGNQGSHYESISADGRYVAFQSDATNLVPGDTNHSTDIFVHDLQTGATIRASLDSFGGQISDNSTGPVISGDGRYVMFGSWGTGIVPGDTNGVGDVFVRDLLNGTTERVSVDSNGIQGNAQSDDGTISYDGRYALFTSFASNLAPGDTNGARDCFVHDRQTGVTSRLSVGTNGTQANGNSYGPALSTDGRWAAFSSDATNLVAGDTNMRTDIFLSDRFPAGFTSLCDPGSAGVIGCPCANPPAGSNQGCDNSSATGGATLSASGIGYVSLDSLVFTTSGERATATSILLQGNALASSGIIYGQGVRCVGGTLKRLFTKSAIAGSITAPEFGAGDPTVSARSAAAGDVIQGGQSRWYLVYYRDPTVLGGCSSSSTFNATQTGRIDWLP